MVKTFRLSDRVWSRILIALLLCFGAAQVADAQDLADGLVQINGVTMTADSLRAVAGTTILVKNRNRGVYASDQGVFAIVCNKGDTIRFSSLGYRDKDYVIPTNIKGQYFSMIQLMVQDTFYLPETIIRPMLSKDNFDYVFRNNRVPDDKYEIARRNVDQYTLRVLAFTLPRDGRENQQILQSAAAQNAVYYGQQRPITIFDPLKWAEFFDAWKRGDFRKQY